MRLPISHIAVVALASLFAVAAQANPLALELEPGNAEGTVRVSLTNTGTTTLSVLRWDTPFEKILSSDVFQVERSHKGWPPVERAAYVGREVKRAEPAADQYFVLEPGTTISQSVELNDYYRIDKADKRNVRFAGEIRYNESNAFSQGNTGRRTISDVVLSSEAIESNSVQVDVSPQISLRAVAPAYNSCSIQQQTDIVAAAQLAQDYVNTGIADLQSLELSERSGSPRYTTWFGTYSETRFNRVLANYVAIADVLENEQIRFDCGCDESGVYAYVYPNRPYDVFLCPAFRAASVDGTDSRAGTIVHELSHFAVIADTDDHVYSQRGAQSLASTDPDMAISNADNHEYFAENTPALDILGATGTTVPVDHQNLALDTVVSGSVAADSSVTYQVSGASQISLTSLTGDADLYLYTDSALTAESCSSTNPSELDVCETFAEGTVYVKVFGYTDASYTLEATVRGTDTPPVSAVDLLIPNTGVSGVLEEGERQVFEVSGVELIDLESLSGDADLYVFESLDFTDATLICASAMFSEDSIIDSCTLPSATDTYYVLIVGYSVSDYSLIAVSEANVTDNEPATIDMGRLTTGEMVSESIVFGQSHRFVVSGASSIELTSVTGDTDLRIFATADYEDSGLLCVSAQDSAETATDSCDIASGEDYYIEVLGYQDSTYNLVAAPLPEEDDPTPDVPVTEVPVTEVPVTQVPEVEVPVTEVPVTETPVTEIPETEVPVTQTPEVEVPVTQVPEVDVPVTGVPVTQVPVTQVPVTQVPVTQVPVTEAPETEVPGTEAPETEAPETEVPETEVPVTQVPATEAPETEVPVTETPETEAPVAEVPETQVPESVLPETEVSTNPQVTDDSPAPIVIPVSSFGTIGNGSLNFLGLGLLMLTVAYRRSEKRRS